MDIHKIGLQDQLSFWNVFRVMREYMEENQLPSFKVTYETDDWECEIIIRRKQIPTSAMLKNA